MSLRIQQVITQGTFALDGGTWDVENNVWVIGNDEEALVVDAAHNADAILEAVGERRLTAVVCTHAHNDHINAAVEVAEKTGAPVYLHLDDHLLWSHIHPDHSPAYLCDQRRITIAGTDVVVLHTPGHTPGAVSLYVPELNTVLTGDTLFAGGPGATGRSFSDFPTIIRSIRDRLLTLPPNTEVLTGHGPSTTIADEAPHLNDWIARGH